MRAFHGTTEEVDQVNWDSCAMIIFFKDENLEVTHADQ